MGIVKFVKNQYVKSSLQKLTEGNLGSTIIGGIAVTLLSMNIDFDAIGLLFSGDTNPKNIGEAVKALAGTVLGAWAWNTGRREEREKRAKVEGQKPASHRF